MEATVISFLSWVSVGAVNTPEPIVLLVLGALFLVLSFRVRARTKVAQVARPEALRAAPRPSSVLLPQQGR